MSLKAQIYHRLERTNQSQQTIWEGICLDRILSKMVENLPLILVKHRNILNPKIKYYIFKLKHHLFKKLFHIKYYFFLFLLPQKSFFSQKNNLSNVFFANQMIIILYNKPQYNNYINKMKNKGRIFQPQKNIKNKANQIYHTPNRSPIKSSYPDKRPANIIGRTRSPSLQQIKKIMIPQQPLNKVKIQTKEKQKSGITIYSSNNKTPPMKKHVEEHQTLVTQQSSKAYNGGLYITQCQQHTYTYKTPKEQQTTHNKPTHEQKPTQVINLNEFQMSQDNKFKGSPIKRKSTELQYIKLLHEKEQTIIQLRLLLEMINQNSNCQEKLDNNDRIIILQRKLKEYGKQIKILEIENQCLISVIENNNVNIRSNKEDSLMKQIVELKLALEGREKELLKDLEKERVHVVKNEEEIQALTNQCSALIKLLNDRSSKITRISPISNHSLVIKDKQRIHSNLKELSQKEDKCLFIKRQEKSSLDKYDNADKESTSAVNRDKQRVTLSKIKQQYLQNLRLIKENVKYQFQDTITRHLSAINQQNQTISIINHKIYQLQAQVLLLAEKVEQKDRNIKEIKRLAKPQEIQSLLAQKYKKYMQDLARQKQNNQKLYLELSIVNKTLRQYELKSFIHDDQLIKSHRSIIRVDSEQLQDKLVMQNEKMSAKIRQLEDFNVIYQKSIESLEIMKDNQIKQLQKKLQTTQQLYQAQILDKNSKNEGQHSSAFKKQIQKALKQVHMYKGIIKQKENTCQDLKQQNEYLRNEIQQNFKQTRERIKLSEKKSNNTGETQKNNKNIQKELQQIKKHLLILENNPKESTGQTNERLLNLQCLYEIKIQENQQLLQEKSEFIQQIHKGLRQRNALNQKIINLQKNMTMYQQELKERRFSYQNLIKDKVMIEKEAIIDKKINFSELKQKNSRHLQFIQKKIDHIIEIQSLRQEKISLKK